MIVCRFSVLINVESFLFNTFVYAYSYRTIRDFEQDKGHKCTE